VADTVTTPQVILLAALLVVIGVAITNGVRALRYRPPADPPLPRAEATHVPSDGDDSEGNGYYVRDQRARLRAETKEAEAKASLHMTVNRLVESERKRNER
jgi:hypothetical protein